MFFLRNWGWREVFDFARFQEKIKDWEMEDDKEAHFPAFCISFPNIFMYSIS